MNALETVNAYIDEARRAIRIITTADWSKEAQLLVPEAWNNLWALLSLRHRIKREAY